MPPTDLPALLELLYCARRSVDRLACDYRLWEHPARFQAALLRDANVDRDAAFAFRKGSVEQEEPQERLVRLWRDGRERLREEEQSAKYVSTAVRNGSRWWAATSMGAQAGSDENSGVLVTGGTLGL